ncbi:MAG TPA: NAD(P)-dependent oxidoreductase, partial [Candidatus Acidoferrales bacterium]|nr:NAD(P)-dependent oxidoreductase [Candidatus Acidoferrales bacterium]
MGTLGFVGLGAMGGRIARRLLEAGHQVAGYNRTRAKAAWLEEAGLQLLGSPREVAAAAEVTFSMVTDTAALEAVAQGPDGILAGLGPGRVYVEMSTVSPAASRALAEQAAARGAQMLDAPVSGSVSTLEQGRLSIMVGGEEAVFERVKPILLDIGPTVHRVGGNGQAVLMKIAINLSLPVHVLAFAEGVLLAEKGGIPRETALEVMLASVIGAPQLQYRARFFGHLPAEAWFDCNMMQKDLQLALEAGRQLDVPLPTTSVANEYLTAARGLGLEKEDFAALYDVLATLSGVKP